MYETVSVENVVSIDSSAQRVMRLLTSESHVDVLHPHILRVEPMDDDPSDTDWRDEQEVLARSAKECRGQLRTSTVLRAPSFSSQTSGEKGAAAPVYELRRYKVWEAASCIPSTMLSYKYRLNVLQTHENRIATASYRAFGIRITSVFSLTERNSEVVLHEELSVRAPSIIAWFVTRRALNAHVELLDRIKRTAESAGYDEDDSADEALVASSANEHLGVSV